MKNRNEIHITNKTGEQKTVNHTEYNRIVENTNRDIDAGHYFDVDWYLNNGCMTLEEMFEKIENRKTT